MLWDCLTFIAKMGANQHVLLLRHIEIRKTWYIMLHFGFETGHFFSVTEGTCTENATFTHIYCNYKFKKTVHIFVEKNWNFCS